MKPGWGCSRCEQQPDGRGAGYRSCKGGGGGDPPMSAAERARISEYEVPVSDGPNFLGPPPVAAAEQLDLSEYAVPISEGDRLLELLRPTNWSGSIYDMDGREILHGVSGGLRDLPGGPVRHTAIYGGVSHWASRQIPQAPRNPM